LVTSAITAAHSHKEEARFTEDVSVLPIGNALTLEIGSQVPERVLLKTSTSTEPEANDGSSNNNDNDVYDGRKDMITNREGFDR
jgi:hypothetical protein